MGAPWMTLSILPLHILFSQALETMVESCVQFTSTTLTIATWLSVTLQCSARKYLGREEDLCSKGGGEHVTALHGYV